MAAEIFRVGKWCCETIISGVSKFSPNETKQQVLLAKICVAAFIAFSFLIVCASKSLFFGSKMESLAMGFLAVLCHDGIIMIGKAAERIQYKSSILFKFLPFFKNPFDLKIITEHTILNKAYYWAFIKIGKF